MPSSNDPKRVRRVSAAALVAIGASVAALAGSTRDVEAAPAIEPREVTRLTRCKGPGVSCRDALDHCCSDLSCMEGRCCAHVGGACTTDDDCCFADCEKGVCSSGR